MLLSSVGIYGVLDYWVKTRQKDIAIRIAIGGQRSDVLLWTGRHVLRMAALGIGLGVFGCWAASRLLESMVFGVSAENPLMIAIAAGLVVALAAFIASIPIWRAAQVDPIIHLRDA